MGDDLGGHGRMLGSGDDLQGATAVLALFDVDSEYPFEQPGLAKWVAGVKCIHSQADPKSLPPKACPYEHLGQHSQSTRKSASYLERVMGIEPTFSVGS